MYRQHLHPRAYLMALIASASIVVLAPEAPTHLESAFHGMTFEATLLSTLALVQIVVSAWFLLALAAQAGGSRARWARWICPAFVGALVTFSPAHAGEPQLDGLTLPDRPVSSAADRPPAEAVERPAGLAVTVERGDTLWSISASRLDPRADDAEIAQACVDLYEANRRVIGDDPDLIRPGMRLHAPELTGTT